MKRALAFTGFTVLGTLAAAVYAGQTVWLPLLLLLAAALLPCLLLKKLRQRLWPAAVCLSAITALLVLGLCTRITFTPFEPFAGKTAQVVGSICEEPYTANGRFYYNILTETISAGDDTIHRQGNILVSSDRVLRYVQVFDRIEAQVHFSDGTSPYQKARGIVLSGYVRNASAVSVTPAESRPLYGVILDMRRGIDKLLHRLLPEEQADFASVMLTGEKHTLSTELRTDLRRSGMAHIVSVSGFHVSVITAFFLALLLLLTKKRRRLSCGLCAVFVLLYMLLAGFSPSVSRAGTMQILWLLGCVLQRKTDPVNSLGLSMLLLCLCNPYAAVDTGLLLSFSATLGILVLIPRLNNYFLPRLKAATDASSPVPKLKNGFLAVLRVLFRPFSITLSAFLFTLPVMILCFRRIYPYTILTNLLIAPLLTALMLSVVIMLLLQCSMVLSFLTLPFIILSGALTGALSGLSGFVAALPFSELSVSQAFVPVWLLLSIAAAAVLYAVKAGPRTIKLYSLAVTMTFLLAALLNGAVSRNVTRIAVLSTGDGLSVLLLRQGTVSVLSCGGSYSGYSAVTDYLDAADIRSIRYLLLTDGTRQTSCYARRLMTDYPVDTAEVYDEGNYTEELHTLLWEKDSLLCRTAEDGTVYTTMLEDSEIISGVEHGSGYILLTTEGVKLLICTDGTDCSRLPEACRQCDLMVTNGQILHREEIRSGLAILSGAADGSITESSSILSTLDGHVIIRPEDGHYSIRRESVWLN